MSQILVDCCKNFKKLLQVLTFAFSVNKGKNQHSERLISLQNC
jgi:hypothetical protein